MCTNRETRWQPVLRRGGQPYRHRANRFTLWYQILINFQKLLLDHPFRPNKRLKLVWMCFQFIEKSKSGWYRHKLVLNIFDQNITTENTTFNQVIWSRGTILTRDRCKCPFIDFNPFRPPGFPQSLTYRFFPLVFRDFSFLWFSFFFEYFFQKFQIFFFASRIRLFPYRISSLV